MSKRMNIKHHLNDQLLMAYAAGALPEAFDLVVATHISMCDDCRAALHSYEAVGGTLLNDVGSSAVSSDCLSNVFSQIDGAAINIQEAPKPSKQTSTVFPSALMNYVGGDVEDVKWKSLGMGVKQSILKTSKGATARLLHIEAGCEVPDHGHRGTELTLVLQGAFSDEIDRFGRGDLEIANEDLEHQPKAEMGQDCICLAATDASLRFNAFLPRLLQPIFRI